MLLLVLVHFLSCQVLIGNRMWMVRNGIDVTPDIEQQIVHHEERGQTVVLTAINSEDTYIQYTSHSSEL